MKYSPTATLALALAAGIAGAAVAQTTATPGAASNAPQPIAPETQSQATNSPPPGAMQPQANYGQAQPGAMQPQANQAPTAGHEAPAGGPVQPGYNQNQANRKMPMQPAPGQAQNTSDQVRTAQEQLQAAGLYKGPADGMMDPDTRAAIANFQQQNGMQRTATLDQPTLDRLMAGRTSGSGSGAPGTPAMPPSGDKEATTAPIGAGGNTGKSTAH